MAEIRLTSWWVVYPIIYRYHLQNVGKTPKQLVQRPKKWSSTSKSQVLPGATFSSWPSYKGWRSRDSAVATTGGARTIALIIQQPTATPCRVLVRSFVQGITTKFLSDLYTLIIVLNHQTTIGITWAFYNAIISCQYINVYGEHMGAFWTSHPSNRQSEIEIFANRYILYIYNPLPPHPPTKKNKQTTNIIYNTPHLLVSFKVTPIPLCHSWVDGLCWDEGCPEPQAICCMICICIWLGLTNIFLQLRWGAFFSGRDLRVEDVPISWRWCVGFGTLCFGGSLGLNLQRIILVHFPICYRFEAAEWSSFNKLPLILHTCDCGMIVVVVEFQRVTSSRPRLDFPGAQNVRNNSVMNQSWTSCQHWISVNQQK